jgi:hypothetical protein
MTNFYYPDDRSTTDVNGSVKPEGDFLAEALDRVAIWRTGANLGISAIKAVDSLDQVYSTRYLNL